MRQIGRRARCTLTLGAVVKETEPGTVRIDGVWLTAPRRSSRLNPFIVTRVGDQRAGEPDERGWITVTRDVTVARIGRGGRHRVPPATVPLYETNTGRGLMLTLETT